MSQTLPEILVIARMSAALARCPDLGNASMRTAIYVAAGIDPKEIHRFDEQATKAERQRRKLYPTQWTVRAGAKLTEIGRGTDEHGRDYVDYRLTTQKEQTRDHDSD